MANSNQYILITSYRLTSVTQKLSMIIWQFYTPQAELGILLWDKSRHSLTAADWRACREIQNPRIQRVVYPSTECTYCVCVCIYIHPAAEVVKNRTTQQHIQSRLFSSSLIIRELQHASTTVNKHATTKLYSKKKSPIKKSNKCNINKMYISQLKVSTAKHYTSQLFVLLSQHKSKVNPGFCNNWSY